MEPERSVEKLAWWQRGVIYQIYPRSFQDTNGDGVGDLAGITARLDHLAWLGVDALWVSPIYPSPMADFGYDVSDYCAIDPLFGTMADFDRLVAEAHARGLKVILDFVPNHTSDQHPWFQESRSSRDNPKRDWYLWREPKPDGAPPNNWIANFGAGRRTHGANAQSRRRRAGLLSVRWRDDHSDRAQSRRLGADDRPAAAWTAPPFDTS